MYHVNSKHKKTGLTTSRCHYQDTEGHFIMVKELIHRKTNGHNCLRD